MTQGSLTSGPDTRQLPAAAAGSEPQSRSAAGVPVHEECKRQQPDQADPSSQLSATEIDFIAETTRAAELISRVKNHQQSGPLKLAREDLATLRELKALADPDAALQSLLCRVQSRADKLVKSGRMQGAPPGVLCGCMDAMTSTEGLCVVSMPCKPLSSCAACLPKDTWIEVQARKASPQASAAQQCIEADWLVCTVTDRAPSHASKSLTPVSAHTGAAKLLEACAAGTRWTQGYVLAAKRYQAVHMLSGERICCTQTPACMHSAHS